MRHFFEGFAGPWEGLGYMRRNPVLWRHAVLPVLCNLLVTGLLLGLLIWKAPLLFAWLDSKVPSGGAWEILQWVVYLSAVAALLGLLAAAWLLFQGIFCGYFYGRLAREVEIRLGMDPAAIREVPLTHEIADAFRDLAVLSAVSIGCFVLSLIPPAAPLAFLLGLYFNFMVFGMDYLGYPQSLRARRRSEQLAFARAHRAHTLGLGASVMLLSLVPILSSLLLTTAAAGAVLLHRRLE